MFLNELLQKGYRLMPKEPTDTENVGCIEAGDYYVRIPEQAKLYRKNSLGNYEQVIDWNTVYFSEAKESVEILPGVYSVTHVGRNISLYDAVFRLPKQTNED